MRGSKRYDFIKLKHSLYSDDYRSFDHQGSCQLCKSEPTACKVTEEQQKSEGQRTGDLCYELPNAYFDVRLFYYKFAPPSTKNQKYKKENQITNELSIVQSILSAI